MGKDQAHPLKEVSVGGGPCRESSECGEGHCSFRQCVCHQHWVGPKCLVSVIMTIDSTHVCYD